MNLSATVSPRTTSMTVTGAATRTPSSSAAAAAVVATAMTWRKVVGAVLLALLVACGSSQAQTQSETTAAATSKIPEYFCANRPCSYDSELQCQCDDACASYGDCCPDYAQVCTDSANTTAPVEATTISSEDTPSVPPYYCANRPCSYDDQLQCQCDDACASYGDCCPDHEDVCNGPTTPTAATSPGDATTGDASDSSCADRGCGHYSEAFSCQCDAACTSWGDCCHDYNALCGSEDGGDASTTQSPSSHSDAEFEDTLPDPLPVLPLKPGECTSDNCVLPDCTCSGNQAAPQGLSVSDMPQIVMLTFDDAVNNEVYPYFEHLLTGRRNPNGCPTSSTFYVSHRYTNYRHVQELYQQGHEIASHTITHSTGAHTSAAGWEAEIVGQREIINNFAFVPSDEIVGFRAPYLQPGGDQQYTTLAEHGFYHDSTLLRWKDTANPMFPYTLDWHASSCLVQPCPSQYSYPGLWELPLLMWYSVDGNDVFGMPDEYSPPSKEAALNYFRHNFQQHFNNNRAPFNIYIHASWFMKYPHALEALDEFLDELLSHEEVYMVSQAKAIAWMRNPVSLNDAATFDAWKCDTDIKGPKPCTAEEASKCTYQDPYSGGIVVLETCAEECPPSYPWVGNTSGQ